MKVERGGKRSLHLQLRQKLYHNNLYRQFHLIAHMNKQLQVRLDHFMAWPQLPSSVKVQQLGPLFKQVGFLHIARRKTWRGEHQYVRLQYEGASKIVLVTGWHRQALVEVIALFNQELRHDFQYPTVGRMIPAARITSQNGFWTTIETNSEATAFHLKRYLRRKKLTLDEEQVKHHKIQKRRIRIVILKEDLFALLVDAMTEIKSQLFLSSHKIATEKGRRQSSNSELVEELKQKGVKYYSLYLMNEQGQNQKGDWREDDLSDGLNSESNSLNSDVLESNRLKECIETTEQGIQAAQMQTEQQSKIDVSPVQSSPYSSSQIAESPQQGRTSIKTEQTLQGEEKIQGLVRVMAEEQSHERKLQPKKQPLERQIQEDVRSFMRSQASLNSNEQKETFLLQESQNHSFHCLGTQTRENLYSEISFGVMRRYLRQFRQIGGRNLVELPSWAKSQSQTEQSRRLFLESMCRPSIIERSRGFY